MFLLSTPSTRRFTCLVLALAALGAAAPKFAATDTLVTPATMIVDHSLPISTRDPGRFNGRNLLSVMRSSNMNTLHRFLARNDE